jgi:hypothetical protein
MPRPIHALLAVAAIGAGSWFVTQTTSQETRLPRPIEYLEQIRRYKLGDEEIRQDYRAWRKQHKQGRKDWIESMHRAAPDVDWRQMDAEWRRQYGEEKRTQRMAEAAGHQRDTNREVAGEWIEKGSNNLAGRMRVADLDQETGIVWAGSDGGNIWTLDPEGIWSSHNDWLRFNDIQMVRRVHTQSESATLVLSSWPVSVQRSLDDGFSWQAASGLSSIAGWGSALRGCVTAGTSPRVYVLGTEWDYTNWHSITSLYRSDNLGASFTRIHTFNHDGSAADMWTPEQGSGELYLTIAGELYSVQLDNSLIQLAEIAPGLGTADAGSVQLDGCITDFGTVIYAMVAHNSSGDSYIFRSLDGGQSFSYRGAVGIHPFMRNSFGCSLLDREQVWLGGVNAWRSTDGGQTWSIVNEWYEYYNDPTNRLHADIPCIQSLMDETGTEFQLISTDGGIYRSDDFLASVQNISLEGLRISQYYGSYTHRTNTNVICAGAQDQGFQRALSDPGSVVDFTQTISGDYAHLVSGDGGNSIWTVYPGFAMYYPDIQQSTSARFWDFVGSNYFWLPPLMPDPNSPSVCWLGGGGSSGGARLWRLQANASSITATEQSYDFSGGTGARISAMAASEINPALRYVLNSNGQLYYSLNAGVSWTQSPAFTGPDPHYFHGATVVPSQLVEDRVYVAGSGYSNPPVFVSEDHGQSWAPMDDGLPGTLVFELAVTPEDDLIFAATELGPFVWRRDTGIWEELAGLDGPDQTYWDVDYIPAIATARFCTYGRGIWDFALEQPLDQVEGLVITIAGGEARLAWNTVAGAESYRVEFSSSPWFENSTVLGESSQTRFTHEQAIAAGSGFYRVIAQNP